MFGISYSGTLILLVLNYFYVPVLSGTGNRWTYEGTLGPDHWPVDYEHCGGRKQSPINIDTSEVRVNTSIAAFNLESYSSTEDIEQELENVGGHTVEVIYGGSPLIIDGGGLPGSYKVDQFHFHWGRVDARGSEHKVNDQQFPMEMHIVHHSNDYANLTEALDKKNGLAVLGFFFEVGDNNTAFDDLINNFDKIEYAGEKVELETPIELMSLLPKNMSVFWRYFGSLTTPPCYETVIWTLFKEPIVVSEYQLNKFRGLKRTESGEKALPLVDDYRPLQPLNERVVETNNVLGRYSYANQNSSNYLCLVVFYFIAKLLKVS